MNLQGKTLEERLYATRYFPAILTGEVGTGKTSAIEMLSPEDKKRTLIVSYDGKSMPLDTDDMYFKVRYLDDNFDVIKSINSIKKAIAHEDVDRVVIDTLSGFAKELQVYANKNYRGFEVYNTFNNEMDEFLKMLRVEVRTHGKFLWLLAHYPVYEKKGENRKAIASVGSKHGNGTYESIVNTVVEATLEDGKFFFRADNTDNFDTTRIRRDLSPYKSNENSLAELEEALSK
jgi:hypothetical protein